MKNYSIIFIFLLLISSCSKENETEKKATGEIIKNEQRINTGSGKTVKGQGITGSGTKAEGGGRKTGNTGIGNQSAGVNTKGGGDTFFIETKLTSDFNSVTTMEKIGRVAANQNIEVKSQVSGKLSQIYVKQGESVKSGQKIAQISDSYSRYYLDLEKTQIELDKQYISKDSQLLSLNQKVTDSKISLDDAQNIYNNAEITYKSEKESALINLDNAKNNANSEKEKVTINHEKTQLEGGSGEARLEFEKAEIDYNNILNSNAQQIQTHVENIKKEYNNLYLDLGDIIRFADEILGVTEINRNKSDKIDSYVGIKDSAVKNQTIQGLKDLILFRNRLNNTGTSGINKNNMLESMQSFSDGYFQVDSFLGYMENTLDNSLASVGTLSQTEIDRHISIVNTYQNGNNGNSSSFINTQNSIKTFLNTYKQSELSAYKNVELQKIKLETSAETSTVDYDNSLLIIENDIKSSDITYTKTLVSIENALNSSRTKLNQAKQAYDNALKNKDVTLRSLNNSIASASNSKKQAQAEYSKLTIVSPISGIVNTIDIDTNSDVSNNTQIITISSDDNTQIDVSLNANEITQVNLGDKVKVQYGTKTFDSEVYSKSSIADDNLSYTVGIVMNEKVELLGGSTVVKFLGKTNGLSVPLQIVDIKEDNVGYINTLVDGKSKKVEVELGKIDGNNIEILSSFPNDLEIIITELKAYNEALQTLEKLEK